MSYTYWWMEETVWIGWMDGHPCCISILAWVFLFSLAECAVESEKVQFYSTEGVALFTVLLGAVDLYVSGLERKSMRLTFVSF